MRRSELVFNKGDILRKETLQEMYDYPRFALEGYYSEHSDGILYGLKFEKSPTNNKHHQITMGAIKYKGNIYFLEKPIDDVEDKFGDKLQLGKRYRLCFVEKKVSQNLYPIYSLDLEALLDSEYEIIKETSFYYLRVKFASDGTLQIIYDQEIAGLFAAKDGYPYKLPSYALNDKIMPVLREKKAKHPLDYLLIKELLRGEGLDLSLVDLYLVEAGSEGLDKNNFVEPSIILKSLAEAINILKWQNAPVKEVSKQRRANNKENGRMM